jgi:hypothetical protein
LLHIFKEMTRVKRAPVWHLVTAAVLLVAFTCQGTWALAGTTGGLTGTVVDAANSAAVAGALVTVNSPSQTASVVTDSSGHFGFLTLAPDTYTVSVAKTGYQALSVPGQIVFADTVQTVTARLQKSLTTIAHVTAVGPGALVKAGTTADVYSINAAGQAASAALGGGSSLNSAYSAIATVPGAYVVPNQMGYFQTVHIRGGDFDQVGYEFDGVPVNRSFDNYPSSSASSLGNAEVQVYTGANPASSEGQGLAGYINQVIRTGTYPGFADGQLGLGTPTFYHRAMAEAGGATPDRLFSYYVGIGGYNQDFRYVDNSNGASYDNLAGVPMAPGANPSYAGGTYYYMGAFNYAALASIASRDVVANVHFGIPHHRGGGRDDVQILWDSSALQNSAYNSTNDIVSTAGCGGLTTGAACANAIGLGQPVYIDGVTWGCAGSVGQTFSSSGLNGQAHCVQNYYFPSSPNRTAPFQPIPVNARDSILNNQEIVKLQYTHNMGSTAFLRVYGYTYYSDWLQNGPQTTYADYFGCCSPDYELSSHTRGVSAQLQDQINAQNLVSVQASYVTASSVRDNNQFYAVGGLPAAEIVSSANPYDGYCYGQTTPGGPFAAVNCHTPYVAGSGSTPQQLGYLNFPEIGAGAAPNLAGLNCGGAACEYMIAENGLRATYNTIVPQFFSSSLTDEFRPSDRWLFNLGVRLDSFTFKGSNTDYGNARNFWTNAYNLDNCVDDITGVPYPNPNGPGAACAPNPATGNAGRPAFFQNISAQTYTYNIWQPRISGTYTIDNGSVVRFSYGRYTEAPNTAFEQYNVSQEDLADYIGSNFYAFGRTTPGYPMVPPTSINYDVSFEHQFKGTDLSFKLTPFLRQTQDQIQNFFLNQKQGFVSGLNVGSQRSQGFEFEMQKGDFSRNGFAGLLSFAYTDSYIHYGTLASGAYGTTVITGTNQAISTYNAYTAACAPGGAYVGKIGPNHVPYCGATSTGVAAAPCYTTAGAPVYHCTAADVANPYWNDPQPLIDPSTAFPTYSTFPGGIGSSAFAYGAPYVATMVLNYKHDKFAITPSFQFSGGAKYGYPQSTPGIDPVTCTGTLPIAGGNGGSRYDANTCAELGAVPNTFTGTFDGLGAFTQPNNFIFSLQASYDVSRRVSLTGVLANIVNTCWGGTPEPWTYGDHNVCSYGLVAGGSVEPVGNIYNPAGYGGSIQQPFRKYPYGALFGPENFVKNPFNFYLTAKIKI